MKTIQSNGLQTNRLTLPDLTKMNDTILDNDSLLETTYNCQTKLRGTHDEEYLCYLTCADDGKGNDFTTGEPLLTFEEWLAN